MRITKRSRSLCSARGGREGVRRVLVAVAGCPLAAALTQPTSRRHYGSGTEFDLGQSVQTLPKRDRLIDASRVRV
jgi:hypothetical protein